ncbi:MULTISPECIES: type VI secretion system contractile sheath large subunit [Marinomonas]|uniref:Type VI secretion system contractile sheath large subunit n=1 Tax=Marinomonas arctica TaxID=383750 RepID=A0A7H1JB88_9GAMM|nr:MULTISPECIES: type VI secretion system contractile sheath large subunit [Marinomonas]MCS7485460.1 type VI secretion protein [Marinomonas sp. BSi20414]QNT07754.1 type VI secretion system contractile sheath large subunit [Marinomonas arctica]
MESNQKKLSRVRSPRVHITYDVEIGDAIVRRELPLIVGVLADLSGMPAVSLPPVKERVFVEIDRDNFNDVMTGNAVRLVYKVDNVFDTSAGPLNLELLFNSIDAFEPINLVKQIDVTNKRYESRNRIRDMMAKLDGNDPLDGILAEVLADDTLQKELKDLFGAAEKWSTVVPTDLVNRMLKQGRMALDESQIPYALELIGEFSVSILEGVAELNGRFASDLMGDKIAQIDNQLTNQINLVMHAPEFQALEATWRGLHFLVKNTETGTSLKIRLLNISKRDLLKDLQKAVEFDQSALFKKIYEEEFGTYGGDPFSFLVGDYEFGRHPEDIELLEKISGVASSAHAPFISSAYAKLFDMEDFFTLSQPRDLSKIFESAELIKWRSFRSSEDARYVSLTLPKVLLRLPYGPDTVVAEGFDFIEDVDGSDAHKYLWGNPAFVLAQRITNAYSKFGWLAAIRGVEGGGLVEGLPAHTFKTPAGDIKLTCPTQVSITDRREKELNDLGFMAILHCKGSDKAAFFGGQTTGQPQKYNTEAANANARISTMLPYVLNASRFAHYIKVIMRDKVGSFTTKEGVSDYLNNWISNYVLVDDSAPQEMKASYPLRESRIEVTDVPGKPGSYRSIVFLRPHFQLEELTTSIRLVAELP